MNDRAVALSDAGNPEAAIPLIKQAIDLWPTNNIFRFNLAVNQSLVARKAGNVQQYLNYQRQALSHDPGHKATRANIASAEAELAFRSGNYTLALAKEREAYAYAPTPFRRASLVNTESNVFELQGDYARALAKMREANSILPSANRQKAIRNLESKVASQQGATQRRAATGAPFNVPGNPANVQLEGPTPGTPVKNQTSAAHAKSAVLHGQEAQRANTDEAAREQTSRSFDTNPTISGGPVDLRISLQRGHPTVPPEIRQKYPQIADLEKKRNVLERDLGPLEERFNAMRKQAGPRGSDWGETYDNLSKEIGKKKGEINFINTEIKRYVLD